MLVNWGYKLDYFCHLYRKLDCLLAVEYQCFMTVNIYNLYKDFLFFSEQQRRIVHIKNNFKALYAKDSDNSFKCLLNVINIDNKKKLIKCASDYK